MSYWTRIVGDCICESCKVSMDNWAVWGTYGVFYSCVPQVFDFSAVFYGFGAQQKIFCYLDTGFLDLRGPMACFCCIESQLQTKCYEFVCERDLKDNFFHIDPIDLFQYSIIC